MCVARYNIMICKHNSIYLVLYIHILRIHLSTSRRQYISANLQSMFTWYISEWVRYSEFDSKKYHPCADMLKDAEYI